MLGMRDVAGDSATKGKRGQVMQGCEARLRHPTFNGMQ